MLLRAGALGFTYVYHNTRKPPVKGALQNLEQVVLFVVDLTNVVVRHILWFETRGELDVNVFTSVEVSFGVVDLWVGVILKQVLEVVLGFGVQ
jgi:hypothetical protein